MNDLTFENRINFSESASDVHQSDTYLVRLAITPRAMSDCRIAEVISLLIQNSRYALQALDRDDVAVARVQALSHPRCLHPRSHGATLLGISNAVRVSADWAAWANTLAVTEPSSEHEKSLISGPFRKNKSTLRISDNAFVPALIAVAQQAGANGDDLLQGIAVASAVYRFLQQQKNSKCTVSQKIHAALTIACGIGRCLSVTAPTMHTLLQRIHQDTVIPYAETADIARYVISHTDQTMRQTYLSEIPLTEPAITNASLNESSLPTALQDERMMFEEASSEWLSVESKNIFLNRIYKLPKLSHDELMDINPAVDLKQPTFNTPDGRGIY